jgi:hypothetical protein
MQKSCLLATMALNAIEAMFVRGIHPILPPKTPEEGHHLSVDSINKSILFLSNHESFLCGISSQQCVQLVAAISQLPTTTGENDAQDQ